MSNSVFKTLNNHVAQLHRNAFDLSQRTLFTSPIGMLQPTFVREVIPGDKVRLDFQSFIQSLPINNSSFGRLNQHMEFFFVPYHQLWSYFNDFITNVPDDSHVRSDEASLPLPDGSSYTKQSYRNNYIPRMSPLMDLDSFLPLLFSYNENSYPVRNGAFVSSYVKSSQTNVTYYNHASDDAGFALGEGAQRLAEMLGYGNLKQIMLNSYIPGDGDGTPVLRPSSTFNVSPFRFLAYQKIFNDYYRLTDWFPNNPFSYNIDYLNPYVPGVQSDNTGNNLIITANGSKYKLDYCDYLKPHYRPWKKDFFTAIKPTASYNYGSLGGMSQGSTNVNSAFTNIQNYSKYLNSSTVTQISVSPGVVNFQRPANGNPSLSVHTSAQSSNSFNSGSFNSVLLLIMMTVNYLHKLFAIYLL